MKNKINLPILDIVFMALFLVILTVLTMIYIPKWKNLDAELMRNFYTEEENTIDVLLLGSCNMYSSYSPPIAYEEYGISSVVFAGPDQELVTNYHYLIDALKTQKIKVVVLESLFLTCEPTPKREYYNRTALDYMPFSLNKLQLILKLGAMESEYMQTVDDTAPNKLLTYAGYLFPLLRYHGREDITTRDITFYANRNDSQNQRGSRALFNYLVNDSVEFPLTCNGTTIRETSREYFIKIRELCEAKGISLLLVKSPNHYRWNEQSTAAVRKFAAEQNVDFLDMHNYDDFLVSDYSKTTGRLNIYGMKKFTEHLCEYIQKNYSYEPSVLTETAIARWEKCVAALHLFGKKNKMTIDAGQIYRVCNQPTGIGLYWNGAPGTTSYSVYRANGSMGDYQKIATINDCNFVDESVTALKPYTYRIEPDDGDMAGVVSNSKYFVFVEMPTNIIAKNENGAVRLNWKKTEGATSYDLQRKPYTNLNFESWDTTPATTYLNSDCTSGNHYSYRIRAIFKYGGNSYYSAGAIVSTIPFDTPKLKSATAKNDSIVLLWEKVKNVGRYEIYRKAENEKFYAMCGVVSSSNNSYMDKNVKSGVNYSYKIVATRTSYEYEGRSEYSNVVSSTAR